MRRLLCCLSLGLAFIGCSGDQATTVDAQHEPTSDTVRHAISAPGDTIARHSEKMTSDLPSESDETTGDNHALGEENKIIERPKHLAPDQSEIDSIKAEKLKKKR